MCAKVLQTPWRLSTSQTPVDQAGVVRSLPNDHKFKNASGIGGGFGPVSKNILLIHFSWVKGTIFMVI